MSARDGLLLRRFAMPQLQTAASKAAGGKTTFDAAAASALVELPEYRCDAMQVGLACLVFYICASHESSLAHNFTTAFMLCENEVGFWSWHC
jgi:hypothetical protein